MVACPTINPVGKDSPELTISTPDLVCTPDHRRTTYERSPDLKPFYTTCLVFVHLQAHATTPSKYCGNFN